MAANAARLRVDERSAVTQELSLLLSLLLLLLLLLLFVIVY
jgi:hypothetical protein